MSRPWEPEQLVEQPLALSLIQQQFPELKANTIFLLGAGWDNTAYLVNEEWIFRFPRRQIAVPLLETEIAILPKLAKRLSTPIPTPKWTGRPSPEFSWPFAGYNIIPGFTACHANLTDAERSHLAVPIAQFLKELHAIPISILAESSLFCDNLERIHPQIIAGKIKTVFDELELIRLLENRKQLEIILQKAATLPTPEMNTLVHGDFYVRHILLNEEHQLAGVIDWGDIHIGNPAMDLAIAHSFLPKGAHDQFRNAYGEISNEVWQLAELRAIYTAAYILLFGHHKPDPQLALEGARALKQIALL